MNLETEEDKCISEIDKIICDFAYTYESDLNKAEKILERLRISAGSHKIDASLMLLDIISSMLDEKSDGADNNIGKQKIARFVSIYESIDETAKKEVFLERAIKLTVKSIKESFSKPLVNLFVNSCKKTCINKCNNTDKIGCLRYQEMLAFTEDRLA